MIRIIPMGADMIRMTNEGMSRRMFIHLSFSVNLTELWMLSSLSKVNVYRSSAGFMVKL